MTSPREPPDPAGRDLAPAAERYVRLVLALGRHLPDLVDAYHGPASWQQEAATGDPIPLGDLRARAARMREEILAARATERRTFLERQAGALEALARLCAGERLSLEEEARALYDVAPPRRPATGFQEARRALTGLLPGAGAVEDRLEAFRRGFHIPPDRLRAVTTAAVEEARRRTEGLTGLPAGERFEVAFVTGRPWNAYNWYLGGYRSRIEINVDLPVEIAPHLSTLAHEAYPGHHTWNILREEALARGNGWVEHRVHPLFTPQSLLAEGTANAALGVIFPQDERWAFLRDLLGPLAGLAGRDWDRYQRVSAASRPLRHARAEAARMLRDEGRGDGEVVDFLRVHGLLSPARARKALDFIRRYGAYVLTYTAGEDLVRAWLGDGVERSHRFFALLRRPAVPSGLRQEIPRSGG